MVEDNGSSDKTLEKLALFPAVKVLHEPKPGSYHARNRGIAAARGDYIAFTDSDCLVGRNWLSAAMAAIAADPEVAIYAGNVELFSKPGDNRICLLYEQFFSLKQSDYVARGICITANWVSPASVLRACGGFNGEFKSGGDTALSKALTAAGHRIVYVPDMVIRHPVRDSFWALAKKQRRLMGGMWLKAQINTDKTRVVGTRTINNRAKLRKFIWKVRRKEFDHHLSYLDKIYIVLTILFLGIVERLEIIRLNFGGKPSRQ